MGKTTNYEEWLAGFNLETSEDVYDLYTSVSNFEGSGRFYTSKTVTNDGYEYVIKVEGKEEELLLESDEQKFAFLHFLKTNYTDSAEDDINKWYELKKELGRVD